MSFLGKLIGLVLPHILDKLSTWAIAMIKAQVKKSNRENKINKEVKALEEAVAEADKLAQENNGKVPPDAEKKLRDAARRLNGNFV